MVEQGDLQLKLGITILKRLEMGNDMQTAERLAHPEMEHATHLAAPLGDHRVRLLRHRHQRMAVAGILLTQLGQATAAGGTLYQLGAKGGLQQRQLLADVRFGDAETASGSRDPLLAHQRIEDHHLRKTLQHRITGLKGREPIIPELLAKG